MYEQQNPDRESCRCTIRRLSKKLLVMSLIDAKHVLGTIGTIENDTAVLVHLGHIVYAKITQL
jgi:hypothetical protein